MTNARSQYPTFAPCGPAVRGMTTPRRIRRLRRRRALARGLVVAAGLAALSGAAFLAGLSFGFEVGSGARWTVLSRAAGPSIQIPASQDPAPGGRAVFSLIAANAGILAPSVTTTAAPDHAGSTTLPGRDGTSIAPGYLFGGRA